MNDEWVRCLDAVSKGLVGFRWILRRQDENNFNMLYAEWPTVLETLQGLSSVHIDPKCGRPPHDLETGGGLVGCTG
jgi:hypothetical protein